MPPASPSGDLGQIPNSEEVAEDLEGRNVPSSRQDLQTAHPTPGNRLMRLDSLGKDKEPPPSPRPFFGNPAPLPVEEVTPQRLPLPSPAGTIVEESNARTPSRPASGDAEEAAAAGDGFGSLNSPSAGKARKATSPVPGTRAKKALTPFARSLAMTTASSPERLAEKMVVGLQQSCLDEANLGQHICVWDGVLPGGRRFSSLVAQALALQLQGIGFASIEWWGGKEFKDTGGRYLVLHNAMYDKYTVRLRVKWTADLQPKATTSDSLGAPRRTLDAPVLAMLNQVRQVLELQQQLTTRAAAAEAAAEQRALEAEVRAAEAEARAKAAEAALAAISHGPGVASAAGGEGSPSGLQGGGRQTEEALPDMSLREMSGM